MTVKPAPAMAITLRAAVAMLSEIFCNGPMRISLKKCRLLHGENGVWKVPAKKSIHQSARPKTQKAGIPHDDHDAAIVSGRQYSG